MIHLKNLKSRNIAILIAFVLIFGSLSSSYADEGKSIDDQTKEISYLLMCPVCQGQSVGESNSNLAQDMRGIIRKQLEEGKTKEEILAYFVSSYGESILASPPPKGINWLLWLLPGAGIIIGGIAVTLYLFRSQTNENNDDNDKGNTPTSESNAYLKRIEKELKESDS